MSVSEAAALSQDGATGEVLRDASSTGRERPWRQKRMGSRMVAAAYAALGQPGKAARCRDCGTVLTFAECPQDGTKHLQRANFCRERLCPMCAWRRSLKWAAVVSTVLHKAAQEQPKNGWVMLTLTQKNVSSKDLSAEVDRILNGWRHLRKRDEFRYVAGFLRTLEVTRNAQDETWHPHIHALLWVGPSYWSRGYVPQKRWRDLWAEVMGLDYDPSVDVHRVRQRRNGEPLAAAAREVAKYAVKDEDLVGDGTDVVARVAALDPALKGRHLLEFGGALRRIAREARADVPDAEQDLVHVTEEDHGTTCPVCGTEMLPHVYRWVQSVRQYVG